MSILRCLMQRARAAVSPRALRDDESGATMLTFGMLAPLAFAAVGLGVDASMWYAQSQRLQATADLAAVAGARAIARGSGTSGVLAAVQEAATRNGFSSGPGRLLDVTLESKEDGARVVQVTAGEPGERYFSGLVLGRDPQLRNSGRAEFKPPDAGAYCVLGLDPTRDETVEVHGAAVADLNCGVMSNSAHSSQSLYVAGTGFLKATRVDAYGGIYVQGAPNIVGPQLAGAWPVDDPYGPAGRNLQPPAYKECTYHNRIINTSTTINPGRFCGGLRITNSNVTFNPGVYVIYGGDLDVSGTSSLVGDGVVFILTELLPSQIGTVKIPGGTALDLRAPSATATGEAAAYAGVLFFQDGRVPSFQGSNLRTNWIQGGSGDRIEGALYFPAQEIIFTGGATAEDRCLQIIARKVTIQGNGTIRHGKAACSSLGVSPIYRAAVKLVT
jgi:hypothetical protein